MFISYLEVTKAHIVCSIFQSFSSSALLRTVQLPAEVGPARAVCAAPSQLFLGAFHGAWGVMVMDVWAAARCRDEGWERERSREAAAADQ